MTTTLKEQQRDVNAAFDALSARAKLGDGNLGELTEKIAFDAINAINAMNAALSPESAAAAEKAVAELRNQLNGASPAGQPANDPTANMPPAPPAPADDSAPEGLEALITSAVNKGFEPLKTKVDKVEEKVDKVEEKVDKVEENTLSALANHNKRITELENHGGITLTVIAIAIGLAIVSILIGIVFEAYLGGIVTGVLLSVAVLLTAALRRPRQTLEAPATSN